jgi:hypothetical protein
MAARDYEFQLRLNNRNVDRVPRFARGMDFDQILDADKVLLWWLVAAVRRAGGDPRKDLDEYEVEIWDKDRNRVERVFAASRHEITDDMLR